MIHHILVDEYGKPVPLPFYTSYRRADTGEPAPATVHNISVEPGNQRLPDRINSRGALHVTFDEGPPYYGIDPSDFGLRIITEEEFMKGQQL